MSERERVGGGRAGVGQGRHMEGRGLSTPPVLGERESLKSLAQIPRGPPRAHTAAEQREGRSEPPGPLAAARGKTGRGVEGRLEEQRKRARLKPSFEVPREGGVNPFIYPDGARSHALMGRGKECLAPSCRRPPRWVERGRERKWERGTSSKISKIAKLFIFSRERTSAKQERLTFYYASLPFLDAGPPLPQRFPGLKAFQCPSLLSLENQPSALDSRF